MPNIHNFHHDFFTHSNALLMPISRRSVLRGLSATTAALIASPLASALAVGAEGSGYAKRFIMIGMFNGFSEKYWYPQSVDNQGYIQTYGRTLMNAGFAPYIDKTIMIKGLNHESLVDPRNPAAGSDGHVPGMCTWNNGGFVVPYNNDGKKDVITDMPSIDQIIAPSLSAGCPIQSIQWSVDGLMGDFIRKNISFQKKLDGGVIALPSSVEPINLYNVLALGIGKVVGSSGNPLSTILNPSLEDIKLAQRRFPASTDVGQMLAQHFETLNGILRGYQNATGSCDDLTKPNASGYDIVSKLDQNINLTHLALKCGLTNVVSINLLPSGSDFPAGYTAAPNTEDQRYLNVGPKPDDNDPGGVHSWSHAKLEDRGAESKSGEQFSNIQSFHLKRIATLCAKLDGEPEDGGTMLDNTLMYLSGEVGQKNHYHTMIPCLLVGGAGGYFGRMGRYIVKNDTDPVVNGTFDASGDKNTSTARAMLSVAHACGREDLKFIGHEEYCSSDALIPKV